MTDIVISEFMDEEYIDETAKEYDVHYDPDLVDNPDELRFFWKKPKHWWYAIEPR